MLWLLIYLFPLLGKAQTEEPEAACNYMLYYGTPFATDRCNTYTYRGSYYYYEQSHIFRCSEDGNTVITEYYDTWNCSGWPYSREYNSTVGNFYCNGTTSCYISTTGYSLDQPCGESYSDSYWYYVYAKDICVYDTRFDETTTIRCENNKATVEYSYGTQTCDDPNYSWKWSSGCNMSTDAYTRYVVNCNASNEQPPVAQYEEHYCDTVDCWPTPSPTPYVDANRNDEDSCAYVNWYGEPLAPDRCFAIKYTWYDYVYLYSYMMRCSSDDEYVYGAYWDNGDCDGEPSWTDYYFNGDFNCIGTTSCHAASIRYQNANFSDETCADTFYEEQMVYATDVCVSYWGYGRAYTCENDTMKSLWHWNSNCSGEGYIQGVMRDGCNNIYNDSVWKYYDRYEITCNAGLPREDSDSSSKAQTLAVIVGSTLGILVLIIVAIGVVAYFTRQSRFTRTKIDRTGMLTDVGGAHHDEIFNDDGRGIRNLNQNTSDFATVNTTTTGGGNDLITTTNATTTTGENQTIPTGMAIVGMQSEDEPPN